MRVRAHAPKNDRHKIGTPIPPAVLVLALVLQMGLARQLGFDPTAADGSGSQGTAVSQVLTFFGFAAGISVLFSSNGTLQMFKRCWPIFWLPALATLSTLWSVFPRVTLASSASYLCATLCGFAIACYRPSISLGVIIRALSYCCILSMVYAIFYPALGVHQATEAVQAVHAGFWRGIMGHKVTLGVTAGITLPLLIFLRAFAFKSIFMWGVATISAAACLVFAASTTGFAGAVILSILIMTLSAAVKFRPSQRRSLVMGTVVMFLLSILLLVFGELGSVIVLFGKSEDLTGRAYIWPAIMDLLGTTGVGKLLGYGYVAGMRSFVGPTLMADFGNLVGDPHNGYLNVLVAFGYVGSATVFLVYIWLIRGSVRLINDAPSNTNRRLIVLPASMLGTFAYLNYSETMLMVYYVVLTHLTPLFAVWIFGDGTLPERRRPRTAPTEPQRGMVTTHAPSAPIQDVRRSNRRN